MKRFKKAIALFAGIGLVFSYNISLAHGGHHYNLPIYIQMESVHTLHLQKLRLMALQSITKPQPSKKYNAG